MVTALYTNKEQHNCTWE